MDHEEVYDRIAHLEHRVRFLQATCAIVVAALELFSRPQHTPANFLLPMENFEEFLLGGEAGAEIRSGPAYSGETQRRLNDSSTAMTTSAAARRGRRCRRQSSSYRSWTERA